MATHANTAQSMGIKCMKGGGTCTPVQPYISGTGVGHIQENPRSSRWENGNACQHSPEHGNKMYERG